VVHAGRTAAQVEFEQFALLKNPNFAQNKRRVRLKTHSGPFAAILTRKAVCGAIIH
jgi:hypothetical protein